jgi:hypothetical protein
MHVKQLQEIRLNEDLFAIENLKETFNNTNNMSQYGRNNIWLTDIIP